jgi:superoxide dismutase
VEAFKSSDLRKEQIQKIEDEDSLEMLGHVHCLLIDLWDSSYYSYFNNDGLGPFICFLKSS